MVRRPLLLPHLLCAGALALTLTPCRASEPASAPAAPAAASAPPKAKVATEVTPPAPKPVPGSMEALRVKLAERLGAVRAPDGSPYVLRVTGKGDGAAEPAPAKPTRAASAHTSRAPAKAEAPGADAHAPAGHGHDVHWGYDGPEGPQAWGQIKPEFSSCATGQRQSPIDIQDGLPLELQPISFDYHAGSFSVLDNGHTVQVIVPPGNAISVGGRRYELLQFHFHRPAEERVRGQAFDMDVHLVHKDVDGRLAVVAVLLERGNAHALIQAVWNALPLEKNVAEQATTQIDPAALLPEDRRYFTYMGSLTTPPCTEGVLWLVLKQPVQLSPQQVGIFARLYPMNARPIQQTSGRLIKEGL